MESHDKPNSEGTPYIKEEFVFVYLWFSPIGNINFSLYRVFLYFAWVNIFSNDAFCSFHSDDVQSTFAVLFTIDDFEIDVPLFYTLFSGNICFCPI